MIRDRRLPELFLIPAAQTRDKSAISPSDMVTLCNELRAEFEYIFIDSPAGIERGFRNSIAPADRIVVITNPEVTSVRDADRIIGLIEAEEKGPPLLIINRIKPSMVRRGEMLSVEDILELLAVELIGMVPDDEMIIINNNRGIPVVMDGKSKAGQAFRNIAIRLTGAQVPFLDLEDQGGMMGRLKRMFRP